ncbi:MAG: dockerin type I repeat-containing protein [Ruminococcus sp.]
MKKTFIKAVSSLISLTLFGTSLMIPADAEVIQQMDPDGNVESTFFINVTPAECDEYKLFPNHFGIDPDDPLDENGSRAFFTDPSAKICIEYNIFPNKYNIIPPRHVTGNLITENNGYYKYLSDKGYSNSTFEVQPNVYPCKKGICYDVIKRYRDEILYLYLPLDAEDIPKAEAFIEADDREGLYDFLAEKNAYEHPYFGELNDFTAVVNRDYTPAIENIWAIQNYTPDQVYQEVIDKFVYPNFQLPPNPTDVSGAVEELDYELIIGDANMDGKVSLFDIIMVNKMSIGSIVPSNSIQRYLADVDGSTVIDTNDVTLLVQYVVDKIDGFPVEL